MNPVILIACDKFKGSLTASQVNQALQQGIYEILSQARIQCLSVSDGGQGLIAVVSQVKPLELRPLKCRDPLGRSIQAQVAWDPVERVCLIESAAAIGLQHLKPSEYDIWKTNSLGLGDLIQQTLAWQPERILIGLGGSACCDGGLGMLSALGYAFYDQNHQLLPALPSSLQQLHKILAPELILPPIDVIADVLNPPLGPQGGVRIYSPQKGADPKSVELLEQGMQHFLSVLDPESAQNLADLPCGGAAGCLGLTLHALWGARLIPGSQWILEMLEFNKYLAACDFVITGEGQVDLSSWEGKITGQIVEQSLQAGKSVLMVSGQKAVLPTELSNVFCYHLIDYDPEVADSCERSQQVLLQIGRQMAKNLFKK